MASRKVVGLLVVVVGLLFGQGRQVPSASSSSPWTDDGTTIKARSGRNVAISTTLLVGHNTTGTIAVAKSDSGKVFTTSAATADVTYSLAAIACSAANEGVHFKFVQTHLTHDLYVDPNDADQFRGAYTTGVNGNRLKGDRVSGSTLSIVCVKDDDGAYRWFTLGVGNWSEVL